ncbi:hypothetical protein PENTCL1PPCAC_21067, partial [Pristionchus entomophagus]
CGLRIRKASLFTDFIGYRKQTETISQLYEGMSIKQLNVEGKNLTDLAAAQISEFIRNHSVDELTLNLHECSVSNAGLCFDTSLK